MIWMLIEQIRYETFLPASYCDEIDHSLRKKIILSEIVDDQVVVICMISSPFFPFTCPAPAQAYFSFSGRPRFQDSLSCLEKEGWRENPRDCHQASPPPSPSFLPSGLSNKSKELVRRTRFVKKLSHKATYNIHLINCMILWYCSFKYGW